MFRATVGVHPHHAREFADGQVEALERLTASPVVGAIGECGLDYFRNFSSHEDQERVFHQQLALAGRVRKPVFLHQRDAHEPLVSILREHVTTLTGGVAHCFTGDRRELDDCLDLGLSIGITGWICDERRGYAPARTRAAHPARSADGRDRRAVPVAARPRPSTAQPAQRAAVFAACRAYDCKVSSRIARGRRSRYDGQCADILRVRTSDHLK